MFLRLSDKTTAYVTCDACNYAEWMRVYPKLDRRCSSCDASPELSTKMLFDVAIPVLVDQIDEASFALNSEPERNPLESTEIPHYSHTAIVLMYCMLREALVSRLLGKLFDRYAIPETLRMRMLRDNQGQHKRTNSLLPALTGEKWKKMLERAESLGVTKTEEHDASSLELISLRNDIIHKAQVFGIGSEQSSLAKNSVRPLIKLFVGLHNAYVAKTPVAMNNRKN